MFGWSLDRGFSAAFVAIVLATVAGVLTAQLPGEPWVAPVVAGITALAALIRRHGGADTPADGAG